MQSVSQQNREKKHLPRHTLILLLLSILYAAAACFAQIRGSLLMLYILLAVFLGLMLLAVGWRMTFPMLLFFLPWSPLLKLYQGGISFYTLGLLLVCIIHFLRNGSKLRPFQVLCTAVILVFSLTAKAIQGHSIAASYLFFVVMLILFPSFSNRDSHECSFLELTVFFALGIISAALIARRVAAFPRISEFIKVDSYLTITRLSGFYGDPNFYSAHITACFAGLQLLMMREKGRWSRIILLILSVVLIYCGLLSASKSFVVVLAFQAFVWVIVLMGKNNRGKVRIRILLGAACAVAVLLLSSSVQTLLQILDTRFSYAANIAQITTGRTTIWRNYLHELAHNPLVLLLGHGFTAVTLSGRGSHNTILQGVFQFGLLGFPFLIAWLVQTQRTVYRLYGLERVHFQALLLMLAGVITPWFGLDLLFFDEFFLFPLYITLSCIYYTDQW